MPIEEPKLFVPELCGEKKASQQKIRPVWCTNNKQPSILISIPSKTAIKTTVIIRRYFQKDYWVFVRFASHSISKAYKLFERGLAAKGLTKFKIRLLQSVDAEVGAQLWILGWCFIVSQWLKHLVNDESNCSKQKVNVLSWHFHETKANHTGYFFAFKLQLPCENNHRKIFGYYSNPTFFAHSCLKLTSMCIK